jgi:hypothetical protein
LYQGVRFEIIAYRRQLAQIIEQEFISWQSLDRLTEA